MTWVLALIAVVYLSAATFVQSPNDFVSCCIAGCLATWVAADWWEDTQ